MLERHELILRMKWFFMTCRIFLIIGTVLILLAAMGSAVQAMCTERPEKSELGTFTVQFENDLFAGSDQHYTNGIRLSWLSPEGDSLEPLNCVRDFLEALPLVENNDLTRFGLAMGQEMYTPVNRTRSDVQTDDRPYAGWLYGSMSLHTVHPTSQLYANGKALESVEIQLGIIGPQAYAKEAQDLVHDLRLIDRFDGWENQLRNEPGLLLMYERKWRPAEPIDTGPLQFDFIPHAGASIGNVLTHANVGGVMRYGYNLPHDFGPPSLIKGVFPLDNVDMDNLSMYLFASAEGRAVAHNIFLEGNTFTDSHSVDGKPLVADIAVGMAVMLGRLRVAYTHAFRSREFEGQDSYSRFGSLSASFQAAF